MHYFKGVWLHEEGEGVPGYLLACQVIASYDAVGGGFEMASCQDLGGLAQLESQHFRGNRYLGGVGKSVLSKEASGLDGEADFLASLVGEDGGGEGGEGAVVVVPAAPVVLGGPLGLEGEVVEHPPDVGLPEPDGLVQVAVGVALQLGADVGVDLEGEHGPDLHHHRGEPLHVGLAGLQGGYISGRSSTHLLGQ